MMNLDATECKNFRTLCLQRPQDDRKASQPIHLVPESCRLSATRRCLRRSLLIRQPVSEPTVYRTQFFGHRLTLRRPA